MSALCLPSIKSLMTKRSIPGGVRLVRHQDNRAASGCTPYNLWRAADGRLETYQRIQKRKVFHIGNLLASFVATPTDDTLFIWAIPC